MLQILFLTKKFQATVKKIDFKALERLVARRFSTKGTIISKLPEGGRIFENSVF